MQQETEDEYRRRLYVAMTRAADRLIVGGCQPGNRKEVRENSWYDLIEKGLANSPLQLEIIETANGPVRRYRHVTAGSASPTGATATQAAAATPDAPLSLPAWLHAAASRASPTELTLRPSDSADDDSHTLRTGESQQLRNRARQRGTLVHRLLQSLPDIAPPQRHAAAASYLARAAEDWHATDRDALATQMLALIDDPRFAAVFAPGSRAEVAIAGRLKHEGRTLLVSGRIDRLAVTPDTVMIVDYKTNPAPPGNAAEPLPA